MEMISCESIFIFPSHCSLHWENNHKGDVIMSAMASQITGVSIVYQIVCSGEDQRKHQSTASLAFVRRIYRWPMNSPHKGIVRRKMFPFDDVIMMKKSVDKTVNVFTHCCLKVLVKARIWPRFWGVVMRKVMEIHHHLSANRIPNGMP